MTKKLILHIPHSSDNIPDKTGYIVDDDTLNKELLLLTDWHTDDLFSTPDGVAIVADFNRVFCDVERFADDSKERMSAAGMGVIYTKCDDGNHLRSVSDKFKAAILDKYYYPHHQRLSAAVAEQLSSTGKALIIDCHSFSNEPFKRDINQQLPRPDFCIGTDDSHTPRGLYKYTLIMLRLQGYSVQLNKPYSGSLVPMEYYLKNKQVTSIMIEVNRDLYLIPGTNQKSDNYHKLKLFLQDFLDGLRRYDFKTDIPKLTQSDKSKID